ncbi:pirin family protein [Pseudonocardia kujensis]|uniref:pirin family protein n=1 Tax=Pseudonocardia kujensis TaxID=1128675 RepID=UPI001E2DC8E0|nr:pirin family protein [Pseudonocardia kujensis]MCE0763481.1 pirin family protein [Pseudonocardia kujensis]
MSSGVTGGDGRVELRRGADRARTVHAGCEARHGFSFGAHYDPANTFFGALLAHNDERVAPGAGYDTHAHDEVDLVTWVVAGELAHTDSLGNEVRVRPGTVQVLSTGTGVEHAERCGGPGPVRFVQAWLVPDGPLRAPALTRRDVGDELAAGRPFLVASGRPGDGPLPLPLRRADGELYAARLPAGAAWSLPEAPYLHVFLVAGSTDTPAGELGEGDELRVTAPPAGSASAASAGSTTLTAGPEGAEVLVWSMGSDLRPG